MDWKGADDLKLCLQCLWGLCISRWSNYIFWCFQTHHPVHSYEQCLHQRSLKRHALGFSLRMFSVASSLCWKPNDLLLYTFFFFPPSISFLQDAGIWFVFHSSSTGDSHGLVPETKAELTPLGIFYNNRVHSNFKVRAPVGYLVSPWASVCFSDHTRSCLPSCFFNFLFGRNPLRIASVFALRRPRLQLISRCLLGSLIVIGQCNTQV